MTWVGVSAYTSNFLNFPPYKPCNEKNSSMLLPSLDSGLLHYLVLCKYMTAFIQGLRTQRPIFHALTPRVPLHTARYTPRAPGEEAASEVAQNRVNERQLWPLLEIAILDRHTRLLYLGGFLTCTPRMLATKAIKRMNVND